jgi:TonB family protein
MKFRPFVPILCVLCALCVFVVFPALAQETVKVAGVDVPPPKRNKFVMPEYPPEAMAQGLRGIVILDLTIDGQGHVAKAEVVRSVPPFDEAAVAAVRKWEYDVTKVDGKPVSVRLTVPITFAMRLPEVTRQEGIPDLRAGAAPKYPPAVSGRQTSTVVAELTLEADGHVAEAQLRSGDEPFAQAVLQAIRTWRFAASDDGAVISFRVQADFVPANKSGPPRVELHLTGLHRSEAVASATPADATAASAPAAPSPQPASTPTPTPAPPPQAPSPSPEPTPGLTPPTLPGVPVAPPAEPPTTAPPTAPAEPAPAATPTPSPRPLPPTDVISVPAVPQGQTASGPGVSSIQDVTLDPGLPDLVKGRRPVVPPLARMAESSGKVEVRFSVDASGQALVQSVSGPDVFKRAAEQVVSSWVFRRVSTERIYLVANIEYGGTAARAAVRPAE